jgi:septal ring factor EnvC (AmiA/AmiB activator)
VAQVRSEFEKAKLESGNWLKGLLAPLRLQIAEHKAQLDKRTESLMKIHENQASLQKNIDELEAQLTALQTQSATLDQILLRLMKAAQKTGPALPAVSEDATAGGPTLGVAPLTT